MLFLSGKLQLKSIFFFKTVWVYSVTLWLIQAAHNVDITYIFISLNLPCLDLRFSQNWTKTSFKKNALQLQHINNDLIDMVNATDITGHCSTRTK